MRELLTTDGRIPRGGFWKNTLIIGGVFLATVVPLTFTPESQQIPAALAMIALTLSAIGLGLLVQIKRWHDRDKSGWWALVNLLPVIGSIWTLIECGFLRGTDGANRFGHDPIDR